MNCTHIVQVEVVAINECACLEINRENNRHLISVSEKLQECHHFREKKYNYSHITGSHSLCPGYVHVSTKYQQELNREDSECFVRDDPKAVATIDGCFNAARAAAFSFRRLANLKSSSSNGGGGYIGGASSLDTR